MKVIRSLAVLFSIAIVVPVFAAAPGKFKDWEKSPQGYFMTKAEQQEWAKITTEEEAQHFVDQFLAKRGPKFEAEVADRAGQADKHLSLGKVAGSKTLRGKMVILLGPPSGMDVSNISDNSGMHRDNPYVANAYSGGTGSGGGTDPGGSYDAKEAGQSMGGASLMRLYHFTYASTPSGPLDVTILAEDATGKDRPRDRENAKKLDAVFEAAAQASIKTK